MNYIMCVFCSFYTLCMQLNNYDCIDRFHALLILTHPGGADSNNRKSTLFHGWHKQYITGRKIVKPRFKAIKNKKAAIENLLKKRVDIKYSVWCNFCFLAWIYFGYEEISH